MFFKITNFISPTIVEESNQNLILMDVFSKMQQNRILFLCLPIDEYVANIIQAQLLYLDSIDNKDISIYLHSSGGEVVSGLSIIDVMYITNSEISIINTGLAASMSAVILSSATKGKRYSLKHSRTLIHQISSSYEGDFTNMSISLKECEKLRKEVYQILADNTGKTFEQIEKDCDRDFWMSPTEAKEYGLIDHILEKKKIIM